MGDLINVNWSSKENPKEENDYIVTVLEPLMYGSNGGSSYARMLAVAHYSPEDGWNQPVIAWTSDWIEVY